MRRSARTGPLLCRISYPNFGEYSFSTHLGE
jgi:hypothetical protein